MSDKTQYFAVSQDPKCEDKFVLIRLDSVPVFVRRGAPQTGATMLVLEIKGSKPIETPPPLSHDEYSEWLESVFRTNRKGKSRSKRARKEVCRLRLAKLDKTLTPATDTPTQTDVTESSSMTRLAELATTASVGIYAIHKLYQAWIGKDKQS